MWLALSYLQSFLTRSIISRIIDVNINNNDMKCKMSYYPIKKLIIISYIYNGNMCREIQIPLTSRKFALRMIEDLNQELAIEIYKTEIL